MKQYKNVFINIGGQQLSIFENKKLLRGMSNTAANCFANSVIQCMFSVPLFFNFLNQFDKELVLDDQF